jgi:hypothetical protein
MISSWKEFWLSEKKIGLSLCLLGMVFGLTIGNFIKDWAASFHSIEILNYQILSLISFGIAIGLSIQIASVLLSLVASLCNNLHYNRLFCLLIGIPIGVIIIFNVFCSYLVSLGFIISYTLNLLLPSWIFMRIVGWNTTYLLLANATLLLSIYLVSTGIIWLIDFGRSIV